MLLGAGPCTGCMACVPVGLPAAQRVPAPRPSPQPNQMRAAGEGEGEGRAGEASQLDALTGCPRPEDILLCAVPVCAPYQAGATRSALQSALQSATPPCTHCNTVRTQCGAVAQHTACSVGAELGQQGERQGHSHQLMQLMWVLGHSCEPWPPSSAACSLSGDGRLQVQGEAGARGAEEGQGGAAGAAGVHGRRLCAGTALVSWGAAHSMGCSGLGSHKLCWQGWLSALTGMKSPHFWCLAGPASHFMGRRVLRGRHPLPQRCPLPALLTISPSPIPIRPPSLPSEPLIACARADWWQSMSCAPARLNGLLKLRGKKIGGWHTLCPPRAPCRPRSCWCAARAGRSASAT